MPNYIKVSNTDNNTTWEKNLTNAEFQIVKGYTKGKDTIDIIPATLKPVRTNNLDNFLKDFFLPTTINHAIKVQHAVGRVFAILAALVLDTLTFPARLITAIPRALFNTKKETNLLYKYLTAEKVDNKLLESDHVRVKLGWERMGRSPVVQWIAKDSTVRHKYTQEQHWSEENVNFIELPAYEGSDHSASGMIG